MSWIIAHLTSVLAIVWLEGALITYVALLHADQKTGLSVDTQTSPAMEIVMALLWFIFVPMLLIGATVSWVQAFIAKFKS